MTQLVITEVPSAPDDAQSVVLEEMLAAGRRFDTLETSRVLIELCRLLEVSHASGVVHRCLTPAKVRVRFEADRAGVSIITATDVDGCAPPYAAPEVLAGREADARSDLYSIGVIAHRMVTGSDVGIGRLAEWGALGDDAGSAVAKRLHAVVDRLVSADPEQRSSSAAWVAHALRVVTTIRAVVEDASEAATVFASTAAATSEAAPESIAQALASNVHPLEPRDDDAATAPGPAAKSADESVKVAAEVSPAPPPLPSFRVPVVISAPVIAEEPIVVEATRSERAPSPAEEEDTSAAKLTLMLWLERMGDAARPAIERLELARRAREISGQLQLDRRARALAAVGGKKSTLIAVAAVAGFLLLLMVINAFDGEEPLAGPRTHAELAADARTLADGTNPQAAIDHLEQLLIADQNYGDPHLHAALARAYVRSGAPTRSLQHFAIATRKDPRALDDVEVKMLVGLLELTKAEADAAEELLRLQGDRATPALRELAEDKKAPKALRKRASSLLRPQTATRTR
jgi:hypothetical protein